MSVDARTLAETVRLALSLLACERAARMAATDDVGDALEALDVLVAELETAREELQDANHALAEKECGYTLQRNLRHKSERERDEALAREATLREQVAALRAALEAALDCKGAWEGTVTAKGGYPAVCEGCHARGRAALVVSAPGVPGGGPADSANTAETRARDEA